MKIEDKLQLIHQHGFVYSALEKSTSSGFCDVMKKLRELTFCLEMKGNTNTSFILHFISVRRLKRRQAYFGDMKDDKYDFKLEIVEKKVFGLKNYIQNTGL